jgi:uncharacterized spore protein YtfJ
MPAKDAIKATVDEFLKALSANNIIGEPIELEDKIIIPITKMGMGFGAGEVGTGDKSEKISPGGGAGGGLGVFPVAVVIVYKGIPGPEGVNVIPLSVPSRQIAGPMTGIAQVLLERILSHKEGTEKRSADLKSVEVD